MLRRSDLTPCRGTRRTPGCGAPIRWTTTDANKRLAVDADPSPDGNTAVWRDAFGVLRSRQVADERPLAAWERLMMPHAATCKPVVTPPPPSRPRPSQPRVGVLYDVLGVTCEATGADIRSAYRRLARQLHPDVNPEPAARDRFKAVTAAYDVLSNPITRAAYDLTGRAPRPQGARTP